MKLKIMERLAMGAFVGCFIVLLVMVVGSYANGPQNVTFSGNDVIGAFFGSIIVGWAFSLAGLVYENEELTFPLQVMIQMFTGMGVLFVVALLLGWMPVNLGIGPIVTWIIIAIIFATIFWLGFYIYYKLLAKELNDKIKKNQ